MSELKWRFGMMKVDVLFLAAIIRQLPGLDEASKSALVYSGNFRVGGDAASIESN